MTFKRAFWGVVLIGLGVLLLVEQAGAIDIGLSFWPVFWCLLGLGIIADGLTSPFQLALGLYIGGYGLADILYDSGLVTFTGSDVLSKGWPVLLIGLGISLMFRDRWRRIRWHRT